MFLKFGKDLNQFCINGKVISIKIDGDIWIVWLECYTGQNTPHIVPITITSQTTGKDFLAQNNYVQIKGALNSTKTSPHTFEYQLMADQIRQSDSISCMLQNKQNILTGIAFITQPPRINIESHPFKARVYLGTSSILVGDIFKGKRQYFDMSLLRKNVIMANELKDGDIVSFKASLVYTEEHGLQIIGKELVKIGQIHTKPHTFFSKLKSM